jgi:RNA polymerase sigma factor (sigma-70 family)
MKSYQTFKTLPTNSAPRDFTHLIAVRERNTCALDEFYLLHRREFIKWAEKNFGLDASEALDIYQDAILILYENIRRGKLSQLSATLKTYFFGIGKNLILKKLARCKSEIKRWEAVMTEEEHALIPDFEKHYDCQEDRFDAVAAALNGLSERNKSILQLYYYHKLPLKEIAEQLGYESVDVVKNQKVRCMKYLKKLMQNQLQEVRSN